jgi:hypothetical protein
MDYKPLAKQHAHKKKNKGKSTSRPQAAAPGGSMHTENTWETKQGKQHQQASSSSTMGLTAAHTR